MLRTTSRLRQRRGAIAPLTGVLGIFILAMVAFALDSGWMVMTKSELQNAADSAALAGANKLMDGYVLYYLPTQTSAQKNTVLNNSLAAAKQAAKNFASYNAAGGVAALVLKDEDIEFGFTNADGTYSSTYSAFPNTVKVTMRRDDTANGSLSLFFGRVVGTPSVNLTAGAAATIYAGQVNSLKQNPNLNIGLLPMTFDVNDWDGFVKTGKDIWGKISYDVDGNPQLKIYSTVKDKGNFGELALDDEHAGASEVRGWIANGMLASDTALLIDRGLLPLSAHNPNLWDWLGNTGFKSTNVQDVNTFVGKSFLLPLFTPKNSGADGSEYQAGVEQGSNYAYNIVRFVGIVIKDSDKGNRDIYVQPSAVIEANAVFTPNTLQPAGTVTDPNTGSYLMTTFTTPKLTR